MLTFDAFDPDSADPTFRFRRDDTDETAEGTYHDLPRRRRSGWRASSG